MVKRVLSTSHRVSLHSWLLTFTNTRVVLKDELETSMRLAGITTLDQATPALVNTLDIDHLVTSGRIEPSSVSRKVRSSKL
jgi:hypothetical protein